MAQCIFKDTSIDTTCLTFAFSHKCCCINSSLYCRRHEWLLALGIAYERSSQVVCSDHFHAAYQGSKGRLLSTAIPRPFNASEEHPHRETHTGKNLISVRLILLISICCEKKSYLLIFVTHTHTHTYRAPHDLHIMIIFTYFIFS